MKEKSKEQQEKNKGKKKGAKGAEVLVKGLYAQQNHLVYELSQEESDLLQAGLYFSTQPDKIQKSEIFTTFEMIHRSFLNNLKSEETKIQIKAHLSYLANSYFYNYKPSSCILRQHRILRNLKKNKDIVITKPDKGNGVVILD